jgi:hypothetical protein
MSNAPHITEDELETGDYPLTFKRKGGRLVVSGPSELVVVGAMFGDFVVASVGQEFAWGKRGRKAYRYGYSTPAPSKARARRCDECGYTNGHRMDCALLSD